ncbi:hypothetical protein NEOLEDRAFT_1180644 [Neolentinus lepideus HHB14362 ss-1]|uniref:Uncharacterized protein n=1 Tax=Neolentinus lepideus HHB14362 ss-1 TaxID=1314782 RepID=A0A165QQA1_9AGAM|nr:hypothetical protein NEOLEDRAFT_1180644 [Neolentinus lepideus HHB14362 ss-1]
MSYLTQQQYQALLTRPPPANWSGTWPPPVGSGPWPPGFPGPPPPPPGVPVNPQSWQRGQWVFNPAFRSAAGGTAGGMPANFGQWAAPWQHWGVPSAQVPAGYNPYKRQPKQPDPSYWNTKLGDNGLGLENMHIRNDPAPPELHAPNTPWTWAPRELDASGPDSQARPRNIRSQSLPQSSSREAPSQTQEHERARESLPPPRRASDDAYRQLQGHSNRDDRQRTLERYGVDPPRDHRRQGSVPAPSRNPSLSDRQHSSSAQHTHGHRDREPETFTAKRELQPTFSPNIIRTPDYYRRNGSGSTRASSPTSLHSSSRSLDTIPESSPTPVSRERGQPLRAHASAPSQAFNSSLGMISTSRHSSTSTLSSASALASLSNITNATSFTEEPEPELLSPLVGVTPRITTVDQRTSARASEFRSGTGDVEHRTISASDSQSARPTAATSSRVDGRLSGAPASRSSAVDGRATAVSSSRAADARAVAVNPRAVADQPLTSSRSTILTHHSAVAASQRPITRHHSEPTVVNENMVPLPIPAPVPPNRNRPTPHPRANALPPSKQISRSSSSTSTSSTDSASAPIYSRPSATSNPNPSPVYSRPKPSASPIYSQPSSNPSPMYSQPSPVYSQPSNTNPSPVYPRPPPQNGSPAQPRRVRKGYWNRRGDYLTPDMYIVYAPHDRVRPPDLADYPGEREGYRDHEGRFMPFDESRKELPESIPLRGMPPVIPYERVSAPQVLVLWTVGAN